MLLYLFEKDGAGFLLLLSLSSVKPNTNQKKDARSNKRQLRSSKISMLCFEKWTKFERLHKGQELSTSVAKAIVADA